MIEIKNLTKIYHAQPVVNHLSLVVDSGEIFGLVGPNGSGKTCLLRMMATLVEPSSGDIQIGGYSVLEHKQDVRRLIGFLPDQTGLYSGMTVCEYLDYFASCYQVTKSSRKNLISDLLDLVDLAERKDDWIKDLSLGLQKRLGLARLLIHDPQVLLLDEPSAGLDFEGKLEFQNLLVELAGMGKTIFLTTHSPADTAQICSRIAIMDGGELAAVGDFATLAEQFDIKRKIKITYLDETAMVKKLLEKIPVVDKITVLGDNPARQHQIEMDFRGDEVLLSQVLTYLTKSGVQVIRFSMDDNDLERVISNATRGQASQP